MTRVIKPSRLRPGDVIGVCAPASPPRSENDLTSGVRYLERLGFRVKLGRSVFRKRGYLAGTDSQRAADLNNLFADRTVKAIFTVRGGYGSNRVLSLLDYPLIRRNPKILVGYSDITALHLALFARCELVTFSGPMVASEMNKGLNPNSEEQFWQLLMSTNSPTPLKRFNRERIFDKKNSRRVGRLLGGNLTMMSSVIGTPFFPTFDHPLFLIEEIDERPYRVNRMLQQMKLAGVFENAAGIAIGNFIGCVPEKGKPSLTLRQIFHDTLKVYHFPILSGIHFGHISNSVSFPIGIHARIDNRKGELTFLEAAVR